MKTSINKVTLEGFPGSNHRKVTLKSKTMCNLSKENITSELSVNPDVNGLLIPVESKFVEVLFEDIDAGVGELWKKSDLTNK